ncbi:MAG: tyrosine-type recombinase/integrase [Chthoniobacterales bacterium]|nr:tyrosine-type recombinase/integrase [Chthoniobacterales bacterium]
MSERGPVEVIESRGVRIPIYLNPRRGKESYLVTYFAKGERKRERVANLAEARKRAKALVPELLEGKVHVSSFTLKQTTAITDAVEMLQPLRVSITEVARQYVEAHKILDGVSILQAAEFYAKHREQEKRRGALQPITLPDLVTKYLESIEGQKSRRYVEDLTSKLQRAAKAFNGEIREIRADDLDQWIRGMAGAGKRTKNNYRMAMVTLFSYARDKNHLPRGEQTEAEFVTRYDDKKGGVIGIYTPKEFATLLNYVDERFLPFVALGGFAGLRSIEILRLEWKDIWFEKGYVEVGRDKSKTATRRLAPICPALAEWLKPYAKKDGPVLPDIRNEVHFGRLFRAAKHTLNNEKGKPRVELVHNGLRHSFCSYRMAEAKSAAQVALEAGNSPKMLFEHYRELVTEAEAKEWFSLTPKKVRSLFK